MAESQSNNALATTLIESIKTGFYKTLQNRNLNCNINIINIFHVSRTKQYRLATEPNLNFRLRKIVVCSNSATRMCYSTTIAAI